MPNFNLEDFLQVLERYNISIWPMQVFAFLLGIVALVFAFIRIQQSTRIILSILAF